MGLVLGRKPQSYGIKIGANIVVRVISIQGNTVRLDIDAPKDVPVLREELVEPEKEREQ